MWELVGEDFSAKHVIIISGTVRKGGLRALAEGADCNLRENREMVASGRGHETQSHRRG